MAAHQLHQPHVMGRAGQLYVRRTDRPRRLRERRLKPAALVDEHEVVVDLLGSDDGDLVSTRRDLFRYPYRSAGCLVALITNMLMPTRRRQSTTARPGRQCFVEQHTAGFLDMMSGPLPLVEQLSQGRINAQGPSVLTTRSAHSTIAGPNEEGVMSSLEAV